MRGRSEVPDLLDKLESMSTKRDFANLARFGIVAPKAWGVSIANIQKLASRTGRSHEIAASLWESGWYEARLLAAFVDEPSRVTSAQMDRWCRDFDNWGVCDTICFHLFDRTEHRWKKVEQWHDKRPEFVKRAAFALLASLALHDREAGDAHFTDAFDLIERAAPDDRNFVKKGVSWALRLIGRRNRALNKEAVKLARQLSKSDHDAARWIGRGALKELTGPVVMRKLATSSSKRLESNSP